MGVETPDWVREAVFYQVFPDRFARSGRVEPPGPLEEWDAPPTRHGFKGGDLPGIADRLDYLAELGVNALYLNPIFSSAANHRYHPFDYFEVDPLLGGRAGFDELITAAHQRRMRVILDGVFNHTGRGFWAFNHVLENGHHSPYREWFHFDQARLDRGELPQAYPGGSLEGPLAADWGPEHAAGEESLARLGYRAWWDLPALPKLNVADPGVRQHLLEAAEHWIQAGADGWRLDVPTEIDDVDFWREFRQRVKAANPEAYIVGEIWHVRPDWCTDERFDAVMNYPLAAAIVGYAGGDRLDPGVLAEHHDLAETIHPLDGRVFAERLTAMLDAYDPQVTSVQLNLLGTHDTPRLRTMFGGDLRAVELAYLVLMTVPGAPCIYYGDEIGMQGHMDPDCRAAFPWRAPDTWEEGLRGLVRRLIRLRQSERALRDGALQRLGEDGSGAAYLRAHDGSAFVVALNPGPAEARLPLPAEAAPERWAAVIGVGKGHRLEGSRVAVPPRSGVILERR